MTGAEGWACGAATVLLLVIGVGRAIQRTGDRWREDAAHRRATPVVRRKAIKETSDNLVKFVLTLAIVAVIVAIVITDK